MPEECCDSMSLVWRQTQVANRWADVSICRACEHIHAMESYPAPLRFDVDGGCVNCGGRRPSAGVPCDRCGLTEPKDRAFHDRLRGEDSDATYLQSATQALDAGRLVLGLKLCTASLRWEPPTAVQARRLRLHCLESLGRLDEAMDEAARWARNGGPALVYGIIAALQAAMGDVEAAAETLAYGVREDPGDKAMWADLAELLEMLGDLPGALEAAGQTVDHENYRDRGLTIIRNAATMYYSRGQFDDAVTASKFAGELQRTYPDLAWIRAQASTFAAEETEALSWARAVLEQQPDHPEAKALVERFAPKKKGWFSW